MRRFFLASLPIAALAVAVSLLPVAPADATGVLDALDEPLAPPTAGGAVRADRLLAKLTGHRRLLIIGAHPDDEDTTLVAYVSRALGGEAAYLSLSRGEGGQNLLGPELGVGLGLLRSRELLAARQVDGGRQYFTRAYDFGYTRSLDETLERWPREALLEDAVRVIRRFRPQVVVGVFPPDGRAGHGQHQAAGLVAGEAYEMAGDPQAFPELAGEGLAPWRPQALYRVAWWRPEEATLEFDLGTLERVTGRSIYQIAMASRSQHRCQDMGRLQPLGSFTGRLAWERGAGGLGPAIGGVFAGIDTRLAAIADLLPGEPRREVASRLSEVEVLAHRARAGLAGARPSAVLSAVASIHRALDEARRLLPEEPEPGAVVTVAELIEEKRAVAAELVAAVAGIGLDALAERELLVPGSELQVETVAWDAAGLGTRLLGVELRSPDGLLVEPAEVAAAPDRGSPFRDDETAPGAERRGFLVRVPGATPPSVPYFLERPRDGDLYDWSGALPELRGEPFGPPPLTAVFRLRVADEEIVLEREVVHRHRDQVLGEVRRPLRVVPRLEIAAARDLIVWPVADSGGREIEVTLTSHADRPLAGRVEIETPAGWPQVPAASFRLPAAGTHVTARLQVRPPSPFPPGDYELRLRAVVESDDEAAAERYASALPLVDYPHVRPTAWPRPATVRVTAADLVLPALDRVGYVRGASDRVPEALADVGVPLELLRPGELATRDLSRFDAIVIGSRAYESDPQMPESNPALLDYARAGGLVIVQYQQYQYSDDGYAPYGLEISRPHARVADETAPVTVLDPESPVFTAPNRIGADDWRGWVQERGLYMPSSWEEPFRPLLEIPDSEGEAQRGALLVAPVGEGTFVYTGLAFFRQLPAGVPGAYRLFVNLLALAAEREP